MEAAAGDVSEAGLVRTAAEDLAVSRALVVVDDMVVAFPKAGSMLWSAARADGLSSMISRNVKHTVKKSKRLRQIQLGLIEQRQVGKRANSGP